CWRRHAHRKNREKGFECGCSHTLSPTRHDTVAIHEELCMTLSVRATAMLFAGLALGAAPGQAQSVSGAFTMSGKSFKPTHAAAFRMRDQNAPRTFETYVMLTTGPVDVKKISDDVDPYTVAINEPAAMNGDYIGIQ